VVSLVTGQPHIPFRPSTLNEGHGFQPCREASHSLRALAAEVRFFDIWPASHYLGTDCRKLPLRIRARLSVVP
jgi:hypothetical protein